MQVDGSITERRSVEAKDEISFRTFVEPGRGAGSPHKLMQERPERKCHLCGALYKGSAVLLLGKHRDGCRVSIVTAV